MKIFLIILGLLFSTIANAQSNRNPCVYGVGTNQVASLQGNCLAVGYYLAGVTGAPMPVGGIANASAPTFTEGLPGYLSFDLSGNLRVNLAGSGGGSLSVKSGSYSSAGTGQFNLAITTNTQLTVPNGTTCAQITVESSNIRRTSDNTSATTSNGTLIQSGAQWQDCGPLAAYKFTAVSGSPTLDVEYFK